MVPSPSRDHTLTRKSHEVRARGRIEQIHKNEEQENLPRKKEPVPDMLNSAPKPMTTRQFLSRKAKKTGRPETRFPGWKKS